MVSNYTFLIQVLLQPRKRKQQSCRVVFAAVKGVLFCITEFWIPFDITLPFMCSVIKVIIVWPGPYKVWFGFQHIFGNFVHVRVSWTMCDYFYVCAIWLCVPVQMWLLYTNFQSEQAVDGKCVFKDFFSVILKLPSLCYRLFLLCDWAFH